MDEIAGPLLTHAQIVRALEARGYDTRGGAWVQSALTHFLLDHGYEPSSAHPTHDRGWVFTGAAAGAVPILLGYEAWFAGTSQPATGAPADAPPVPQNFRPGAGLAIPQRVVLGAAAGIGGAILLGVAFAAMRRSAA